MTVDDIPLPRRHSLVREAVAFLRKSLERGAWTERLPSERELCERLQISRSTLRAALAILREDGWIVTVPQRGHRIDRLSSETRGTRRLGSVGLLSPTAWNDVLPRQYVWMSQLQQGLQRAGFKLNLYEQRRLCQPDPRSFLREFISQCREDVWILLLAPKPVQRWFADEKIPCVICGTPYAGVNLPSLDLHHRALCRNAAGLLSGRGHKVIAFFSTEGQRAGELESEAGFLEGTENSACLNSLIVSHPEDAPRKTAQKLQALLRRKDPPSAIFIGNPLDYLTINGWLQSQGYRIPEDISLLSRYDDMFLRYVLPEPARYKIPAKKFSDTLRRLVLKVVGGDAALDVHEAIFPDFIEGHSLSKSHLSAGTL